MRSLFCEMMGAIGAWVENPGFGVAVLSMALASTTGAAAEMKVYSEAAGNTNRAEFSVSVNGQAVELCSVETYHGELAYFGSFLCTGTVQVVVHSTRPVANARVLPESAGIRPSIEANGLRFSLSRPRHLTVEVNGIERVLHLFANPAEQFQPRPGDSNVMWFGPGVHPIDTLRVPSNTTLYLAAGAILRAQPSVSLGSREAGADSVINVCDAKNVRICGRGILDLSALPGHSRRGLSVRDSESVAIEGITLLDSPGWTLTVFNSREIHIDNIKQICRRVNSDGVDLCNSQSVLVENSFLRNNDDEICVKTTAGAPYPASRQIVVRNCTIWNERARGLGITSETRRDISDVTFSDCDLIHDFSENPDCAALAVLVSDSGTMSNIRFENIRVADVKVLLRCWVGSDAWGRDAERGRISGLMLKDIQVTGGFFPKSDLLGCDAGHLVENVTLENVRVGGELIMSAAQGHIATNAFVRGLEFRPGPATPVTAPAQAAAGKTAAPKTPVLN